MKKSSVVSLALKWTILIIVMLAIYLPLAVIIIYSFSSAKSVGGNFGNLTLSLYSKLFEDAELLDATKNTLLIGLVSSVLATLLGTTAAIGIHYMRRKSRAIVDASSQITIVNTEIVTAMGFYSLMLFLRDTLQLPVNFSMFYLIIAHTVISTPYVILTVSPRLKQLNPNLLEASMDLGASPMRSLITVMLPQLAGAMISGFALAFTLSLDDFVITHVNSYSVGIGTISTYVYTKMKHNIPNQIRALSTIIFTVVLIVLVIYNIVKNKKAKQQSLH
ncbi:MAG: ABC transporter permease [Clostridia bacterium]|nr:ABC transporter permease [Clostridia bacterium]